MAAWPTCRGCSRPTSPGMGRSDGTRVEPRRAGDRAAGHQPGQPLRLLRRGPQHRRRHRQAADRGHRRPPGRRPVARRPARRPGHLHHDHGRHAGAAVACRCRGVPGRRLQRARHPPGRSGHRGQDAQQLQQSPVPHPGRPGLCPPRLGRLGGGSGGSRAVPSGSESMRAPSGFREVRTLVVTLALLAAACSGSASERVTPVDESTTTTVEDYPDAVTRWLRRMASEPRPVEPSALPPRHLDAETFPVSLVPREGIVWGGVAPDAIPAIDNPVFEQASSVDWLDDREAVLVLQLEGEPRAYPVQVLMWHEIVNDVLDGRPVAVTYCPLCNSGVAFDRTVGGRTLDLPAEIRAEHGGDAIAVATLTELLGDVRRFDNQLLAVSERLIEAVVASG